jgi:L-aspartate oxidase
MIVTEASHAAPRILYKADHTGSVITEHITAAAARHPLIKFQENTIVTDLIVRDGVCVGVQTLDGRAEYAARGVVLASGGLAGIYKHSTNPPGFNALGSSVALATRAGVETQDLEFVQFHPTALLIPNEARFLLTEALRGEGAILRNCHGEAFATNFHPEGELAPRDIVARGVFDEAQRTGNPILLDITHRDAKWLYERFPTIQQYVSERGLDLAKDWLPITPAAHYTCGGVATDLNGCTSLPGLYAAGEAARTGLHGGNRLASTSLLEGLVFGGAVSDFIGGNVDGNAVTQEARSLLRGTDQTTANTPTVIKAAPVETKHLLNEVKTIMWDHVGVIRTPSNLVHALEELDSLSTEANELFYSHPCRETAGLRDASVAGRAVASAALSNSNAIGAHFVVEDEEDEDAVAAVR